MSSFPAWEDLALYHTLNNFGLYRLAHVNDVSLRCCWTRTESPNTLTVLPVPCKMCSKSCMFVRSTALWFSCKKTLPSHHTEETPQGLCLMQELSGAATAPSPSCPTTVLEQSCSAWREQSVVHSPGWPGCQQHHASFSHEHCFWMKRGTSLCPSTLQTGRECFCWKPALFTLTRHWNQRTAKGTQRNLCPVLMPWKQMLIYPRYSERA